MYVSEFIVSEKVGLIILVLMAHHTPNFSVVKQNLVSAYGITKSPLPVIRSMYVDTELISASSLRYISNEWTSSPDTASQNELQKPSRNTFCFLEFLRNCEFVWHQLKHFCGCTYRWLWHQFLVITALNIFLEMPVIALHYHISSERSHWVCCCISISKELLVQNLFTTDALVHMKGLKQRETSFWTYWHFLCRIHVLYTLPHWRAAALHCIACAHTKIIYITLRSPCCTVLIFISHKRCHVCYTQHMKLNCMR